MTETFEWLRALLPNDVGANQRLATLYQRLASGSPKMDEYLTKSNAAIQRVIDSPEPNSWDMAEAYALKARNIKTRWLKRLEAKTGADAQIAALRSSELEAAFEAYASGFAQDRNHFYSGLNALANCACASTWRERNRKNGRLRSTPTAKRRRHSKRSRVARGDWSVGVELAIEAKQLALARQRTPDAEAKLWTDISAADLSFLTATRPKAVSQKFTVSHSPTLHRLRWTPSAIKSKSSNSSVCDSRSSPRRWSVTGAGDSGATTEIKGRALLFTGHMIDAEDRTSLCGHGCRRGGGEDDREAVIQERASSRQQLDRNCRRLRQRHPVSRSVRSSGSRRISFSPSNEISSSSNRFGAGPSWVERFNRLCERVPPRELSESTQLPIWLRSKKDYSIWQRNNLWMLFNVLVLHLPLTLIALWDHGPADGPGGTTDLVAQVNDRGQKVIRLEAERLKDFRRRRHESRRTLTPEKLAGRGRDLRKAGCALSRIAARPASIKKQTVARSRPPIPSPVHAEADRDTRRPRSRSASSRRMKRVSAGTPSYSLASRGAQRPGDRLARILETPRLTPCPAAAAGEPSSRHSELRARGLRRARCTGDAGTVIGCLRPRPVAQRAPWMEEQFDANRFAIWLEVLRESGAGFAAQRLVEMDAPMVIAALARYLAVFDPAVVDGADLVVPTVVKRGVSLELGGYVIAAKREESWDTITDVLAALENEHGDYFHRVMRGCRRPSNSSRSSMDFTT